MPSTYTTNLGIEKIATGEQSGTWGATTNTNFDLIDQAINGIVAVTLASAGSSGSPNTLAITDGSASDGRNKFIEFVDGGDLGATAYVQLTPNDAEKIVIIRNSLSGSQSLIVFQGTYNASNDFEVPNGNDVVLKFDGAGTGATVTQVFDDLLIGALSAATLTLGGTAITATGAELNYVDGVTSAIQTQLDAKVGETHTGDVSITGELIADSYNESYASVTSSSNATTVDCEAGNVASHTLTENTTFTFSNPPASGTAYGFALRIVQDASASGFTVTWPASVDWPSATAPTLTATASAVDWFVFNTVDGGTTWYGFTAGQALG